MKHWKRYGSLVASLVLAVVLIAGCGEKESQSDTAQSPAGSKIDGSKYLLTAAPAAARNVIELRESANDGDEIVAVGKIGGNVNPWIENRAAFTIVDLSIPSCIDTKDDGCPTPWDYCCKLDELATGTALIKLVDTNNELVKAGAKQLLDLKELQKVTIVGTAKRDDAGNLTILATGLFAE